MKTCPTCGSKNLSPIGETLEVSVPGVKTNLRVIVEDVRSTRCKGCGDAFTSGEDLGRAENLAAAEAIRVGFRDGRTLGWARRTLGLRAVDLAELLDVSAETVSRWENGHRAVDRSVWNAMADLLSDRLEGRTTTEERLRQARNPGGRVIRVKLGWTAGA